MQKKSDTIRMFWIIKVQPLYKCNKFMLNLEQVAFNIIEERMEKPRTLGEKEHLCHCYACCQVTTATAVQHTEITHESLGKKRWGRNKEFHTSGRGLRAAFILRSTIFVQISNVFGNKINFNFKRSLNMHTSKPSEQPPHTCFWSFHFASALQFQRCSRRRVITSVSVSQVENLDPLSS